MLYISFALLGCAAWAFSTVAGGGGALLLLPLGSMLVSAKLFVPALSVGSTVANIHRAYLFRKQIDWKILVYILPGVFLGSFVGSFLFSQFEADSLAIIVAIFLLYHSVKSFLRPSKPTFNMKNFYFFPAALCVAILSSLVGAVGPVLNPFYLNSGVSKEVMIGTKAFSTLVMQISKIAGYTVFLSMSKDAIQIGIMIGIGALLGNLIGRKILIRIKQDSFKKIANFFIFISALLLIYKNLL